MKNIGIICEYNPIHLGHVHHIAQSRTLVSEDAAVICAMSGNFVQRGDLAVFEKHARASAAVAAGADLVIELPLSCVLSSAEGFARGGVQLLNALGIVTHLSFGSELGEIGALYEVASHLMTEELSAAVRQELKSGVSYPRARQQAASQLLGQKAELLETPNNILAIEYIKALLETTSSMEPVTVCRSGGRHDSGGGDSASGLRRMLRTGDDPWRFMPSDCAEILKHEIAAGRGPIFIENAETAVLSRLRMLSDEAYQALPDASEGLADRLARYARTMPTIETVLERAKTKRYAMSRLRRMLWCAVLGFTGDDMKAEPMYIRVLAVNERGKSLLKQIKSTSALPVITKPTEARLLSDTAKAMFQKEAAATDFYALAYPATQNRTGGQEWTISPRVL